MGERAPIDPHWDKVYRSLRNQLKYRERELSELSEDYLVLEQRLNAALAYCRRYWTALDAEAANRRITRPANDI